LENVLAGHDHLQIQTVPPVIWLGILRIMQYFTLLSALNKQLVAIAMRSIKGTVDGYRDI
jgi:hypothetical protein